MGVVCAVRGNCYRAPGVNRTCEPTRGTFQGSMRFESTARRMGFAFGRRNGPPTEYVRPNTVTYILQTYVVTWAASRNEKAPLWSEAFDRDEFVTLLSEGIKSVSFTEVNFQPHNSGRPSATSTWHSGRS